MKCLELVDVSYRYEGNSRDVLRQVNADFVTGKVYSLTGESGSGKSTLLALISGLDTCREGNIYYEGESLSEIDRDTYRAQQIGVIFQGYNLLLNSTAVYNITLAMNISEVKNLSRQAKKDKAYDLLSRVNLNYETANRPILQLSGGEQQRVGIARALSHDPKIIIADEPTGNLDAETEMAILDILVKLAHEEGKCVIIVTHSEKVTAVADEVWEISEGQLLKAEARNFNQGHD